jgi:DNA-binding response OmpR family regulator
MRAPAAPSTPTRILVLVAEPGLQTTFQVLLTDAGYEPHVVATLDDARARMKAVRFAVLLADVFDDTAPLSLQQAHILYNGVKPPPIGLLTTQAYSEEEAQAAGYAFMVRMPFDLAALLAHIATALRHPLPNKRPKAPPDVPPAVQPEEEPPSQQPAPARRDTGSGTSRAPQTTHETLEDPLTLTAAQVRAEAAQMRALAWERLAFARAVQAETLDMQERAAAARRRAEQAHVQAFGVYIEILQAMTRTEEVHARSEEAGAAARAVLAPQTRVS